MKDSPVPSPAPASPIRVLVASADPVYTETLTDFLRCQGMTVSHVSAQSEDGLDLSQVDVLLVETHGIETHGTEAEEWALLERVRRVAPLVEVVAITSDPLVREAVRALRAGLFAVLQYPVSSDQLAETIVSACARKRRAEARIKQLNGSQRWEDSRVEGRRRCPPTDSTERSSS